MGRDVCLVTGMRACARNQLRAALRFDALGMKWGEDQRSSFTLLETFGLPGPSVQFREALLLTDLRSPEDLSGLPPFQGLRSLKDFSSPLEDLSGLHRTFQVLQFR
jgi:hypothetical protein